MTLHIQQFIIHENWRFLSTKLKGKPSLSYGHYHKTTPAELTLEQAKLNHAFDTVAVGIVSH